MDIREFFRQTEGSYEEAMGRFGSEALALRFIKKFPGDPSFAELKADSWIRLLRQPMR